MFLCKYALNYYIREPFISCRSKQPLIIEDIELDNGYFEELRKTIFVEEEEETVAGDGENLPNNVEGDSLKEPQKITVGKTPTINSAFAGLEKNWLNSNVFRHTRGMVLRFNRHGIDDAFSGARQIFRPFFEKAVALEEEREEKKMKTETIREHNNMDENNNPSSPTSSASKKKRTQPNAFVLNLLIAETPVAELNNSEDHSEERTQEELDYGLTMDGKVLPTLDFAKAYNHSDLVGLHVDNTVAIDSVRNFLAHHVTVLYVQADDVVQGGFGMDRSTAASSPDTEKGRENQASNCTEDQYRVDEVLVDGGDLFCKADAGQDLMSLSGTRMKEQDGKRSVSSSSRGGVLHQDDEQNKCDEYFQSTTKKGKASKFTGGELELYQYDNGDLHQTSRKMREGLPDAVVTPRTGKMLQFRGDTYHRVRRFAYNRDAVERMMMLCNANQTNSTSTAKDIEQADDPKNKLRKGHQTSFSSFSSHNQQSQAPPVSKTENTETSDNNEIKPPLRVSLVLESYKIPAAYYAYTTRFEHMGQSAYRSSRSDFPDSLKDGGVLQVDMKVEEPLEMKVAYEKEKDAHKTHKSKKFRDKSPHTLAMLIAHQLLTHCVTIYTAFVGGVVLLLFRAAY